MNFNMLRYVVTLAEEKSFSRAAKALYLSQPSLSQSIRSLEQELGTPLFDRSTSPISLTHAGELYLQWARYTLQTQEQTVRRIGDIAKGARTRLVLGISPGRSSFLLPPVVARFRKLRPLCSMVLIEKPTNEMGQLLEEGQIDLLINVPHEDNLRYTNVILAEERLLIAIPAGFPHPRVLHQEEDYPLVDLSDLREVPFITLTEDQVLTKATRSLCAQSGFLPQSALECRNILTAHAMVAEGIGVAVMPEFSVASDPLGRVHYYAINSPKAFRYISAIYPSTGYISEDAQLFIQLLREELTQRRAEHDRNNGMF